VHTRAEHGNTPEMQTVECGLYFDHRRPTYTQAEQSCTQATLCVHSHEIIDYDTVWTPEWVCSYTLP